MKIYNYTIGYTIDNDDDEDDDNHIYNDDDLVML